MAFEALSEKFSAIIKKIKGQSRLTEDNINDILGEIKIALLEADVNYKVAKDFVSSIKEKALGSEVIGKLNPSEQVIKIVRDEMVDLLSFGNNELIIKDNRLTTYMIVGLQGSGKTTHAAKLASYLKNKCNKKVLLCACDVYRPAAIDQLKKLGSSINVDVFELGTNENPVHISAEAKSKAIKENYDSLIIDTAGRLQIDDILMDELVEIKKNIVPDEIILLTDAMAGQESVNVASEFNNKIGVTGLIMSKMDSDSRGGAAFSIAKVSKIPIKFIGVGEKIDDIEIFYPKRMAERILGMGDVLTLIDKVQENIDEGQIKRTSRKISEGNFTLMDMLQQMKQVQKMGNLGGILKLIPGMPKLTDSQLDSAEKEMKIFEAIINSMTPEERNNPSILKNQRKIRIAKGSGRTSADINRVIKKFEQSKALMKQMNGMKKGGKFPPNFNGF